MQKRNKIFSDLYYRRNKMFSAEESKLSFMVDLSTEITGKASGKLRLIHQRILEASSITKNKNMKTRRQLSEAKKSAEMNSLQLEGTETSVLPDKSPTESIGDMAPKTEVVLERHITGNLVEVSTATKKCVSPREPKAELSGKLVGKRSSQRKIELPDKYGSKRSMLQDSRTTESKFLEAVSQKQFTESILIKCGKKIQPSGEVSNKLDGRISLVEVDGSSTDPSKLINSEDDPALTPAADTLNNKNSLTSRKENSNVRRKYKKKEKYNLPRRSSKRLAGQQPEPIYNLLSTVRAYSASATKSSKGALDAGLSSGDLENRATHCTFTEVNSTIQGVPLTKVKSPLEGHEQPIDLLGLNEQTHQVAVGESSGGDASQDAGTASEMFVNGPSFQVGASSQAEDFFDTLDDIKSTSHESLNNGILLLDDQVIRKEQHHMLESEEFPQKLSFLFQDDPCFDFAYRILARESPLKYKPILERAADMVQKDKPVATGSCSRNLTAKSCSSKAIQAVELEHEASDQNVAIQEKVANDPCNIITLGHEESLNKIEKSLENQTATEEKPQTLEAEQAAVENPCIEFSFPFHDTCPDSDPFFHLAFQSFREDDLFQAYFQENLNTIYNEVNSPAPPSFFECDITPQFDTTGAYVPVFPENSYWPLAGNVSQPLSVESSSQPARNEGFSNGGGVGSDQLISTNSSSLPAGNMASSNLSGVATEKPCLVVKQEE